MSMDAVFEVSRTGLDYERARLESATRNIALADVALKPGQAATAQSVTAAPDFSRALGSDGLSGVRVSERPVAERLVHDPSSPMADAHGMVHYPRINMANQMGVLISASRAYEANVRAFNTLHSMVLSALNIGKR